jgi:hypothetical protein
LVDYLGVTIKKIINTIVTITAPIAAEIGNENPVRLFITHAITQPIKTRRNRTTANNK